MRTFWKTVLLCTALLFAVPLTQAQDTRSTSSGSTRPVIGDTSATKPAGGMAGAADTKAEDKPAAAKGTDAAKGETKVAVPVAVPAWKSPKTFWWAISMAGAVAAVVLVYYIFLRKRAD